MIVGAILTAGVLLIAGCAALLGSAADEVDKEIKRDEAAAAKLSRKVMREVKRGMTKDQVRKIAGKPDDTDRMKAGEGEFAIDQTCWHYGTDDFADSLVQVCFDRDKVDSVSRY